MELDENGDLKQGYYDLLNWQLDDNGEIAFVKVGEYKFRASKFELIFTKKSAIFWNTESSRVSTCDI
jgi:vomeronasal 2 receptor